MRRAPVSIRTFLLGAVLALLLAPAIAGGVAWLIERDHQQAAIHQRLNTAVDYLSSHRSRLRAPATAGNFGRLVARLDLLAQVVLTTDSPPGKHQLYLSPALGKAPAIDKKKAAKAAAAGRTPTPEPAVPAAVRDDRRTLSVGTRKEPATLIVDLFYRPASRATRALVAVVAGALVLLAGLAVVVWLAGRWMVVPLTRLSAEVDKVAGGDLAIAIPRSRVAEVANIAQAVEGMTAALGESAHERAEADEARRFLVTSIAHDLRTPLFALRGHLQAIASRLGDPAVHLERAEARADALERLIGNLFAYTREDYAQPALKLETAPVAELLQEVTAGVQPATRLQANRFELDGDRSLGVVVDRDRVKRALTNVLENAVRYSPPRAPIEISWTVAGESTVEITVQDHGPGIDRELLPHVFEPGIRGAPATGGQDGGAGLGLTIAKRLLEQQHATLTAGNRPGGGATFRVALRRAPSPGAPR